VVAPTRQTGKFARPTALGSAGHGSAAPTNKQRERIEMTRVEMQYAVGVLAKTFFADHFLIIASELSMTIGPASIIVRPAWCVIYWETPRDHRRIRTRGKRESDMQRVQSASHSGRRRVRLGPENGIAILIRRQVVVLPVRR
jgi:hypothetical protein